MPELAQLLLVAALIVFAVGMAQLYPSGKRGRRRQPWRAPRKVVPIGRAAPAGPPDAAEQLRVVSTAGFEKQRLLSSAEAKFLYFAEDSITARGLSWRVMAQVSLGEVLSSPSIDAYRAINSKRVDLLIITRGGEPVAAIEYQGRGHYQGTAPLRDAVKKEALRRAGVGYIEVTAAHGRDDIDREIGRLARNWPAPQPAPC